MSDDRTANELTAARAHPHCQDCRLPLEDCVCCKSPIKHGDRVQTPDGCGGVVYVVMKPPEYSQVLSVSVLLDRYKQRLEYRGTVFLVGSVVKL